MIVLLYEHLAKILMEKKLLGHKFVRRNDINSGTLPLTEEQGTDIFFCCEQVPYHRGT